MKVFLTNFIGLGRIIVSENDSKKVNQSTVPKYRILAKSIAFSAALMTKYDFHVEAKFKKNSLKKTFLKELKPIHTLYFYNANKSLFEF